MLQELMVYHQHQIACSAQAHARLDRQQPGPEILLHLSVPALHLQVNTAELNGLGGHDSGAGYRKPSARRLMCFHASVHHSLVCSLKMF